MIRIGLDGGHGDQGRERVERALQALVTRELRMLHEVEHDAVVACLDEQRRAPRHVSREVARLAEIERAGLEQGRDRRLLSVVERLEHHVAQPELDTQRLGVELEPFDDDDRRGAHRRAHQIERGGDSYTRRHGADLHVLRCPPAVEARGQKAQRDDGDAETEADRVAEDAQDLLRVTAHVTSRRLQNGKGRSKTRFHGAAANHSSASEWGRKWATVPVRMRLVKLGQLMVRIAGGVDREGGGDGPVLVLMHGFGAPATDLVQLYRAVQVPPEVRFVFPAAPLLLDANSPDEMAARAWWMIDLARMQASMLRGDGELLARQTPPGIAVARGAVNDMLDALEREHAAPPERVVIGGFSQGAMLATDVLLRSERPLAGLVILSGAPISVDEWKELAPKRAGTPVLQSHGRADPILPYAGAEWVRDILEGSRMKVEFLPFNGGHSIPSSALERLGPFVVSATSH